MLFGNRGQNLPCVDQQSGKCFITSQVRVAVTIPGLTPRVGA